MDTIIGLLLLAAIGYLVYRYRYQIGTWLELRQARSVEAKASTHKQVTKYRKHTSVGWNLMLCVFTFGLWAPVWLFLVCWHAFGPRSKITTTYR